MKSGLKTFAADTLQLTVAATIGAAVAIAGSEAIAAGVRAWKRRKTKAKESANPA